MIPDKKDRLLISDKQDHMPSQMMIPDKKESLLISDKQDSLLDIDVEESMKQVLINTQKKDNRRYVDVLRESVEKDVFNESDLRKAFHQKPNVQHNPLRDSFHPRSMIAEKKAPELRGKTTATLKKKGVLTINAWEHVSKRTRKWLGHKHVPVQIKETDTIELDPILGRAPFEVKEEGMYDGTVVYKLSVWREGNLVRSGKFKPKGYITREEWKKIWDKLNLTNRGCIVQPGDTKSNLSIDRPVLADIKEAMENGVFELKGMIWSKGVDQETGVESVKLMKVCKAYKPGEDAAKTIRIVKWRDQDDLESGFKYDTVDLVAVRGGKYVLRLVNGITGKQVVRRGKHQYLYVVKQTHRRRGLMCGAEDHDAESLMPGFYWRNKQPLRGEAVLWSFAGDLATKSIKGEHTYSVHLTSIS